MDGLYAPVDILLMHSTILIMPVRYLCIVSNGIWVQIL